MLILSLLPLFSVIISYKNECLGRREIKGLRVYSPGPRLLDKFPFTSETAS